jgi:HD-like signal output (HDOD) protein
MLQIVNSASVGFTRKVSSPFEAVQLLGISTVRSLALSAHVFSCFERSRLKGFSIDRLWDHATRSGLFARRIMILEKAELADAEDACTAGLLHDVGKLMLANSLPEQFQQALTLATEKNINLSEAEQEIFGATHAGAAAYLLGLWGLPAGIVEAVAFHHQPARSHPPSFGSLAAVHAANVLEHEIFGSKDPGRPSEMNRDYLAAIGMADRLEAWRDEVLKQGKPQDE